MDSHSDVRSPTSSSPRILLVEDERIISLAQSFVLKEHGYDVTTAYSGEEALDRFKKGHIPDLVLMDIDLGSGMDGTESARRILSQWEVPIVFLTSHRSREMAAKVRGITRYGYVIKNSGDFVLLSTIEMAIELFNNEKTIRLQHSILQRVKDIARSDSSSSILGLNKSNMSFEEKEYLLSLILEAGPE